MSERLTIIRREVIKQTSEFSRWKKDPGAFEKKDTITSSEYTQVKNSLTNTFKDRVGRSNLTSSTQTVTDNEVGLTHEILHSVGYIEESIINEISRRPWNTSCIEHSLQVEAFALEITEAINEKGIIKLDPNRIRVKGLMHDIGRAASHHPVIHGLAGREILKDLGFGADFRTTTLAHLEAGIGPYIIGVTPETWPNISTNFKQLEGLVSQLPIEEIIVGLADIGKKGVKQSDGSFVNQIADPVEGLVPSAKRRLTTNTEEPSDETLTNLASENPEKRSQSMKILINMEVDIISANQMAMYFLWMGAMKRRLESDYCVTFEGKDGVVERAQASYNRLR